MIPEPYKPMIDSLLIASRKGRVSWSEPQARKGHFRASTGSVIVEIFEGYLGDGMHTRKPGEAEYYVRFELLEPDGTNIDSFSVEDIETQDYRLMKQLYDSAKINARDVLGHINAVRRYLDSLSDPF